jgi:hypothetical protein
MIKYKEDIRIGKVEQEFQTVAGRSPINWKLDNQLTGLDSNLKFVSNERVEGNILKERKRSNTRNPLPERVLKIER